MVSCDRSPRRRTARPSGRTVGRRMGGSNEVIGEPEQTDPSVCRSFLAVCLVSGGMDSCVTAAIARDENAELAFLHVSYGQRTEAREYRAFEELANHLAINKRLAVST